MTQHPFGRWNRDPGGCRGEIVYEAPACWAVCHTHDFQGEPRGSTEEADADMIAHERAVFELHGAGRRLVRGRVE